MRDEIEQLKEENRKLNHQVEALKAIHTPEIEWKDSAIDDLHSSSTRMEDQLNETSCNNETLENELKTLSKKYKKNLQRMRDGQSAK